MSNNWFIYRPPSASSAAFSKLQRLSTYPRGWARGDGNAFEHEVINRADDILTVAAVLGFERLNVFPRRDGAVVTSIYVADDVYDITVFTDGTLEWLHEQNDVEMDREPITFDDVQKKLAELARPQWAWYAYSLPMTTSQTAGVLRVLASQPQASMAEFPASTWTVPELPQAARAGT